MALFPAVAALTHPALLIDNAIKYTPEGGTVRVHVTGGGGVRLVVEDSGPGIPEESISKIFDRFYRVDKARSRAAGGTGLGLSICRWIAESHEGTIAVTSEPGHGARFTVAFPDSIRMRTTEQRV